MVLPKIDANAARVFVKFDRIKFVSIFNHWRRPAQKQSLGAPEMVTAAVRLRRATPDRTPSATEISPCRANWKLVPAPQPITLPALGQP
jgi:hypothetical protein